MCSMRAISSAASRRPCPQRATTWPSMPSTWWKRPGAAQYNRGTTRMISHQNVINTFQATFSMAGGKMFARLNKVRTARAASTSRKGRDIAKRPYKEARLLQEAGLLSTSLGDRVLVVKRGQEGAARVGLRPGGAQAATGIAPFQGEGRGIVLDLGQRRIEDHRICAHAVPRLVC